MDEGDVQKENATHGDGNGRAADNLAGRSLLVDLAEAGPLAELLVVVNLEQVDAVLGAESLDELGVVLLVAVAGKDNKVGLALVNGLDSLAKTTGKTVVNKGALQNLLECRENILLASSGGGSLTATM